jgi:hypothetical protein
MRFINPPSLARGSALIDYAISNGSAMQFDIRDMIGVVAAYIGRGHATLDMGKYLAERLNAAIAERATQTFEMFNGCGLWVQGAAADDVRFIHPTLAHMYPEVNRTNDALLDGGRSDSSTLDCKEF